MTERDCASCGGTGEHVHQVTRIGIDGPEAPDPHAPAFVYACTACDGTGTIPAVTVTPPTYDPGPEPHGIILEHAGGSWWASCTCTWDSGQPMATETDAIDEWVDHAHTAP